ncbi:MAG: hypothetical protein IID16_05465 [Candidatus Marinimicrobia bacterium]|nr:hypothetical protein [Candidatus Neomarinimicrobiota bacterium]
MKVIFNLGLAVMVLALFRCGDNGTGPEDQETDGNVSLSMGVPATLSNLNRVTSFAQAITISRVRLLMEEVKLKTSEEDTADFKIGPLVVDLNLEGNVTEIGVGSIPAGSYNKFEFKVKKLDADDVGTNDPQFTDFIGTERSIVIGGTYDSESFTLHIEEEFKQEIEFLIPIEILSDTSLTNLTLLVNTGNWFIDPESSNELDPTDPSNLSQIIENIDNSFIAFEDDDEDGELEFEGMVSTVYLDNNSFTLMKTGLMVVTDNATIFEGSITSLDSVNTLLSQGNEVNVDGEGSQQSDKSILASEVKFEVED